MEILQIAKTQKTPIIKKFAYGKGYLVLIMGLKCVVMRTSGYCNILRRVIVVRRQVGLCTWFEGFGGGGRGC